MRMACRDVSLRGRPGARPRVMPRYYKSVRLVILSRRRGAKLRKGLVMRAVVMGGTSGIGLATAEQLTGVGVDVIVTGRDPAKLARLDGRFAAAEQLDGTDREAVVTFFERLGSFEHLVLAFSPGAVGLGPVRETSPEDFETAFADKLFAYVHAIRHAQVAESITMISAASARTAIPGS